MSKSKKYRGARETLYETKGHSDVPGESSRVPIENRRQSCSESTRLGEVGLGYRIFQDSQENFQHVVWLRKVRTSSTEQHADIKQRNRESRVVTHNYPSLKLCLSSALASLFEGGW